MLVLVLKHSQRHLGLPRVLGNSDAFRSQCHVEGFCATGCVLSVYPARVAQRHLLHKASSLVELSRLSLQGVPRVACQVKFCKGVCQGGCSTGRGPRQLTNLHQVAIASSNAASGCSVGQQRVFARLAVLSPRSRPRTRTSRQADFFGLGQDLRLEGTVLVELFVHGFSLVLLFIDKGEVSLPEI